MGGIHITEWVLTTIFGLIVLIVNIVMDKKMRKKYKIKQTKGMYKLVNLMHRIGETSLLLIMITGAIFFGLIKKDIVDSGAYFLLFFIIVFGFRFFMEWKYARSSKEHILTFISLMSFIFFLLFVSILKILEIS
ncbi:DUF4181 domain-containing protein [Bacillus sp. AK031]